MNKIFRLFSVSRVSDAAMTRARLMVLAELFVVDAVPVRVDMPVPQLHSNVLRSREGDLLRRRAILGIHENGRLGDGRLGPESESARSARPQIIFSLPGTEQNPLSRSYK